ncbi:DUF2141 domain-containing protein [Gilvimarinus algae]|uniref:DUF2141 domain-containing protein n=1 Tax=Gilvimarinus algae TaxID=3058037 RepID=A0ABT8TH70_9GAMM|nr:DUF2141 domain-containing protein [Gilvimarinus sp. SDUM040014]MDO3383444.1 DUF2141 domain-containing protein [Gilvimarinus sp. SDUM040014]
MSRIHRSLAFVCLAGAALWSGACAAENLTLEVYGNQSPGASLYVAIYRAELDNWDATPSQTLRHSLPDEEDFSLALPVEPGRYAVRAFIDLDQDGQLKTNTRGRPQEPFASSLGDGRTRPAIDFGKSIVTLSAQSPAASISLRYPR